MSRTQRAAATLFWSKSQLENILWRCKGKEIYTIWIVLSIKLHILWKFQHNVSDSWHLKRFTAPVSPVLPAFGGTCEHRLKYAEKSERKTLCVFQSVPKALCCDSGGGIVSACLFDRSHQSGFVWRPPAVFDLCVWTLLVGRCQVSTNARLHLSSQSCCHKLFLCLDDQDTTRSDRHGGHWLGCHLTSLVWWCKLKHAAHKQVSSWMCN